MGRCQSTPGLVESRGQVPLEEMSLSPTSNRGTRSLRGNSVFSSGSSPFISHPIHNGSTHAVITNQDYQAGIITNLCQVNINQSYKNHSITHGKGSISSVSPTSSVKSEDNNRHGIYFSPNKQSGNSGEYSHFDVSFFKTDEARLLQ